MRPPPPPLPAVLSYPLWFARLACWWGLFYGPPAGFWTFVAVLVGVYAALTFLLLPAVLANKVVTGPLTALFVYLVVFTIDVVTDILVVWPTHALLVAFGVLS